MDATAAAQLPLAAGGCAAKLGPAELAALLAALAAARPHPAPSPPELLVPVVDGADAGVYQVSADCAIVQSADFFPPMIADAAAYGRIAAANALSDIYAAGARPVTAVSLLAMPRGEPQERVVAVLAGANDCLEEAGAVLLGGHSIISKELLFGLTATGVVHPQRVLRHNTPRIGDRLVLTKPLGTGILVHAAGHGQAGPEALKPAVAQMQRLNARPSALLFELGASAATDITGFGLIGHALDMLSRGEASYEIEYAALPKLPGVEALAAAGAVCGGTARNLAYYDAQVRYAAEADNAARSVLVNDAQTSGGLLIALPASAAAQLVSALAAAGEPQAAVIGRVVPPGSARITLV